MERRLNNQTVSFFLETYAAGQLDLDPPYQRRSAWSEDYRRFFVDSILRGFPAPAIYLAVEIRVGLPTVYHVIDGKQRLLTLIAFSRDELDVGRYLEDRGLAGRYFSQLPDEMQSDFVSYEFPVENLLATNDSELHEAFDRLNRNVARLNRMELRNARYDGAFIEQMEELSKAPFWQKTGVTNRGNIRRMRDVEFVSEVFLLTMHGVLDGNADLLDDFYAKYDDEIPDEDEHRARYESILSFLDQIPDDFWKATRWKNLADLYGLWAALLKLEQKESFPALSTAHQGLTDLDAALKDPEDGMERAYSDAVRQGQNKDTNRDTRAELLAQFLSD